MKRTITGRAPGRKMTLGDVRQFVASLEKLPDDAVIKAKTTFGKHLRSITVEEEDPGFRDYLQAMGSEGDEKNEVDKLLEDP